MLGHWNRLTRGQLRIVLDKMGQDTQGPKSVLIERLEACLGEESLSAEASPAGQPLKQSSIVVSPDLDKNKESPPILEYPDGTGLVEASGADYDGKSIVSESAASSIVSERARLAGLRARAACLKEKHELDRKARDIQAMQETLELEMKIKEVAAREAALRTTDLGGRVDDFIDRSNRSYTAGRSCSDMGYADYGNGATGSATHLPDRPAEFDPFYELARRFHLPTLEISTFDGDLGRYRCFMRAFHTNIAVKLSDEEEKLHYLYQFTSGKPREIVSTCLHLPPERGFAEAVSLLDRRYGRPAQVATGLVDKLLQFSSI